MSAFKTPHFPAVFFGLSMILLFCQSSVAQEARTEIVWQDVEVRMMKDKSEYPDFELRGEWVLRGSGSIQSPEDLNKRKIKKIKKHAARLNCSWVFVRGERSASLKGLFYIMGN